MLDGTRGVLIAVSGGADSVALLDMLVRLSLGDREWELEVKEEQRGGTLEELRTTKTPLRLCPSAPQPVSNTHPPLPIPRLHVAHLDHMLRGRESAADAEFVRNLAGRLGIQITIRSADVRGAAKASGRGIEEIAREIRYDFLLGVANEAGCDRIAVGHTMTDQAETFLMRLIRGAGLRGLAAMRPVSEVPKGRQGEGATGRRGEGKMGRMGDEALSTSRCLPFSPSPPLPLSLSPRLLCSSVLCCASPARKLTRIVANAASSSEPTQPISACTTPGIGYGTTYYQRSGRSIRESQNRSQGRLRT